MASSLLHISSCHPSHLHSTALSPRDGMTFLKRFRSNKNKQSTSLASNADSSSASSKRGLSSTGVSPSSNTRITSFSSPSNPNNPFSASGMSNPSPPTRRPAASSSFADPPPAYEPPPYSAPIRSAQDDQYAFLSSFDTVFLIDDSGSMAGRSWRETAGALSAITPICTLHDADGIDIHFLNTPDNVEYCNITKAADVTRIFETVRPYGGTPTGQRLLDILKPYLRQIERKGVDEVKPLNIIVITDGVPSDDVESVIKMAMKKLEKADAPSWQVGIQFFQVGNEYGAAEALKELDDSLPHEGCQRDIVDTVPWSADQGGLSAEGILKVVLGAVNKKLDRKRNSSEELRSNRRR